MIGQGLGRLAFAEKLSIPQLEEALANKTIPAYIGVPLLEEKVQMRERMMSAQAGMSPPPQMTIEEEIMARANQAEQGIDELPVELPDYAGGGIVALAGGGLGSTFDQFDPGITYAGDIRSRDPSTFTIEEKLRYLQGRVGYPQIAALKEGKISLDKLFSSVYEPEPAPLRPLAATAQPTAPQAAPPQAPPAPPAPPAGDQTNVVADPGIAPPETPAPRGASQLSVPDLIGRAEQLHGALYGDQKPEAPAERGDYLTRAQEFLTQSGVDLNLASKQAEEVARQKAELEGDRREAKKFSVISAGLAILAGDPANSVAENIGKGLGKGMEQYTTAIKDLKKTEREMQALERSLAVAQNQARMGVATMAAGDYRDAQKRYDDLNKEMRTSKADLAKALMSDDRARQVVDAQMQSKPSQYSEIRKDLIAGGMTPGQAAQTFLGATKTGAVTPALIEKEWGDMKQVDRLRLRQQGINTVEDYVAYRMRGGTVPGPAAGGASNDPLGLRTP